MHACFYPAVLACTSRAAAVHGTLDCKYQSCVHPPGTTSTSSTLLSSATTSLRAPPTTRTTPSLIRQRAPSGWQIFVLVQAWVPVAFVCNWTQLQLWHCSCAMLHCAGAEHVWCILQPFLLVACPTQCWVSYCAGCCAGRCVIAATCQQWRLVPL